jgi:hypothetical protein
MEIMKTLETFARNALEVVASASLGVLSFYVGALLLVALRVALSPQPVSPSHDGRQFWLPLGLGVDSKISNILPRSAE